MNLSPREAEDLFFVLVDAHDMVEGMNATWAWNSTPPFPASFLGRLEWARNLVGREVRPRGVAGVAGLPSEGTPR